MTLRDYIEGLQEFVQKNEAALDWKVVTADDDEGNSYSETYFQPSAGKYEVREFVSEEEYEDYEIDEDETNAVCVN